MSFLRIQLEPREIHIANWVESVRAKQSSGNPHRFGYDPNAPLETRQSCVQAETAGCKANNRYPTGLMRRRGVDGTDMEIKAIPVTSRWRTLTTKTPCLIANAAQGKGSRAYYSVLDEGLGAFLVLGYVLPEELFAERYWREKTKKASAGWYVPWGQLRRDWNRYRVHPEAEWVDVDAYVKTQGKGAPTT